jgi:hypothetical protein
MENNGVDSRYTYEIILEKCALLKTVLGFWIRQAWILVGWIQVDKNDPQKVKKYIRSGSNSRAGSGSALT